MRWPWVSRRALEMSERTYAAFREEVTGMLTERVPRDQYDLAVRRGDEARSDLRRERIRTAKMTDVLLRMKRDGAVLLPDRIVVDRPAHRELTKIEKAIDDNPHARQIPALRRQLLKWADKQKAAGRDEEWIEERLRKWSEATHEDDDDEDDEPL